MPNIYKIIRRKRNLRRLGGLWLFLLVVELFCPAIGDRESVFAAESIDPRCEVGSTLQEKNRVPNASPTAAHDHQNHEQDVCHDECLCHATAIPSVNIITLRESVTVHDRIAFRDGDPLFNSLPPPFHPPKNS